MCTGCGIGKGIRSFSSTFVSFGFRFHGRQVARRKLCGNVVRFERTRGVVRADGVSLKRETILDEWQTIEFLDFLELEKNMLTSKISEFWVTYCFVSVFLAPIACRDRGLNAETSKYGE